MSRREALVFTVLGLVGPVVMIAWTPDPATGLGTPTALLVALGIYLIGWGALITTIVVPARGRVRPPRSALGFLELLAAAFTFIAPDAVALLAPVSPEVRLGVMLGARLLIAVGLLVYAEAIRRERDPSADVAFRLRGALRDAGLGVGAVLAALPAVHGVSALTQYVLIEWFGRSPEVQWIVKELRRPDLPEAQIVLLVLLAIVAAPVFEEVLFRGFLQGSLRRPLGRWGAIVVSALLFGAIHGTLDAILPLVVLGVVLAMIHDRARSLVAPIAGHAAFNALMISAILIERGGGG